MKIEIHTRQPPLNRQTNRQNRHQRLIRHRINNRAHHRLQIPFSRNPSVYQIRDPSISKESNGPRMLIMQNEVSANGRSDETRKGENIGDSINVFMRGQRFHGFQDFEGFLEGCGWRRWLFAVIGFALDLFNSWEGKKGIRSNKKLIAVYPRNSPIHPAHLPSLKASLDFSSIT